MLKLYLQRVAKKPNYTIGKLYVNGEYFCDTLEDKDRGLNQKLPIATNIKLKVYGETAIPMGVYEVGIHHWTKYRIDVPWIKDVPAFVGILIHNGRDEHNTEGCPLVGENKVVGQLTNGKKYMTELTKIIKEAKSKGERVMIEVTDIPPMVRSKDNFVVPKSL